MELLMILASFLVAGLITLFLIKYNRNDSRLPPGSLGWPIVGETPSFLGGYTSWYEERVARYGPMFKTSLFGSKTVVLPAPEGNRLALMSENKLVENCWPSSIKVTLGDHSLTFLTGEEHRRSKSTLMAFLRPETLQKFVGRTSEVAKEHLEENWARNTSEVLRIYPLVKKFTFALACNLFMGLNVGEQEMDVLAKEFETLVRGFLQVPIDLPGTAFHKAKAARRRLDHLLDRHIHRRKGQSVNMNRDMLGILLNTKDENGLTVSDSTIKDNIVNFLFAGHDTSSVALTWAFKYLAENPSCLDKVVQENIHIRNEKGENEELSLEDLRKMKYTWQVVQETMRLKPPAGAGYRKAIKDIEFQGYVIPKGWKLQWSVYMSYYKPEFFPEPHKFNPSRFEEDLVPYTYFPFGAGARMCPGYEFAKMEILVFLHYCILQFNWSLLEPNEGLAAANPLLVPAHGMPVTISHRSV